VHGGDCGNGALDRGDGRGDLKGGGDGRIDRGVLEMRHGR
jgi:hypothetical protein